MRRLRRQAITKGGLTTRRYYWITTPTARGITTGRSIIKRVAQIVRDICNREITQVLQLYLVLIIEENDDMRCLLSLFRKPLQQLTLLRNIRTSFRLNQRKSGHNGPSKGQHGAHQCNLVGHFHDGIASFIAESRPRRDDHL